MSKLIQIAEATANKLNEVDQAIVTAAKAQVDAMKADLVEASELTGNEYDELVSAYNTKKSEMKTSIDNMQSTKEGEVADVLGATGDITKTTVFGLIKIANDQDASLRSTLASNEVTAQNAINDYVGVEVGTFEAFSSALAGE